MYSCYNVIVTPCLSVKISQQLTLWELVDKALCHLYKSFCLWRSLLLLSRKHSALIQFRLVWKCYRSFQKVRFASLCCSLSIILLECVDATYSGKSISFLNLEINEAGDFCLALSINVNHDRTWEVVVTDLSWNLSTFYIF